MIHTRIVLVFQVVSHAAIPVLRNTRRINTAEWDAAYRKEGQGFQDRDALEVVKPPKGARILDSITCTEYKQDKGVLQKQKVRWFIRRDRQECYIDERYSLVLKARKVRLLTANAAQNGCNLYNTDTKQAFLYGHMDNDDQVYVNRQIGGSNPFRTVVYFGSRKPYTEQNKRLDGGTPRHQRGWQIMFIPQ